ncbi:MAG: glycosyltransferase, partial [Planctomycetota bacterium]
MRVRQRVRVVNAPVRVLRVIARLNVGGPAQHVHWLAQGLVHHGYRTLLAHGQVGEGESPFEPAPGAPGLERVVVPGLGRAVRPADDLRALAHLVRLCHRHRPCIVHTHTAKAGTLGRIAAAIAGVPIVVHTFHGHVLQGYFGPLVSTLIRAVERSLAARTDAIIALSERQRRDLAWRHRVAPASRIHVVPLGIDLAPLREIAASRQRPGGAPQAAALRRRLGVPARAPLLGWIGRLVPIKRIDRALEAFARLDPALGAHLVVAGGGPERERLDALARTLGVRERVHALGVCLPVAPLYAALDA